MKDNSREGLLHAQKAGEMVTLLSGHSSLKIAPLLQTHHHDIGNLLRESLEHERFALDAYLGLLDLVRNHSVLLVEYAREMVCLEEMHLDEVEQMLRIPGGFHQFLEKGIDDS
jgi:bacterioferritin